MIWKFLFTCTSLPFDMLKIYSRNLLSSHGAWFEIPFSTRQKLLGKNETKDSSQQPVPLPTKLTNFLLVKVPGLSILSTRSFRYNLEMYLFLTWHGQSKPPSCSSATSQGNETRAVGGIMLHVIEGAKYNCIYSECSYDTTRFFNPLG